MDFELEVAAIIGKRGKDIAAESAREYIFGYTIYNDFTARDAQLTEMLGMLGPAKGKSFDMGNAMGPVIVTKDEIADVRTLGVKVRINGHVFAEETCGAMLHTFEDMIAFVSRCETIYPGEVFGSGTVGGCCGLERSQFLSDRDVVELEVDGIGVLTNRVERHPAEPGFGRPRSEAVQNHGLG
jgi:2-keto-4-pentenoate hydratase/2-oxohepta-3-ene-1,7-dioic acid hydratase in catechol pathway